MSALPLIKARKIPHCCDAAWWKTFHQNSQILSLSWSFPALTFLEGSFKHGLLCCYFAKTVSSYPFLPMLDGRVVRVEFAPDAQNAFPELSDLLFGRVVCWHTCLSRAFERLRPQSPELLICCFPEPSLGVYTTEWSVLSREVWSLRSVLGDVCL